MNKPRLKLFLSLFSIFLLAFLSGFYGKWQFVAIILLPLFLYLVLWKKDERHWNTKNCISLIITLIACILILAGNYFSFVGKLTAWICGLVLLTCGILMVSFTEKKNTPFVNFIIYSTCFLLLTLLILGFNPFIGIEYSGNEHYRDYAYSKRGVYLIKKDSLIGLRDRFSIIETPKFKSFDILSHSKPFLAVFLTEGIGIYNMETHEFDVKPTQRCYDMMQVDDTTWNMLNKEGVVYRQILLPNYWYKEGENHQIRTTAVKDNEGNVLKDYLLDIGEEFETNKNPEILRLNESFESLKDSYSILGKMVRISGCENTPRNNLLWHQIIKELISETGLPQDTVICRVDDIIGWFYGGSQSEINQAAYMEQVIAQYKQLDVIANHLEDFPEYYDEYEAYSKMETAVFYKWIDGMYAYNHYSSLPMDVSYGIINCMNENTALLTEQYNLISNSKVQGEDRSKNFKVSKNSQSDNASNLDSLVEDWISLRENISQQLSNSIRKRYDEITNKIMENFSKLNVIDYEL